MGARASGNVGGRVFCVACAPAQVGSSRPAVTITMGPWTSSSDFCVPVLGCSLVQISYRPPSGSVGSGDALFGGSNGTFEGPLRWHHSWAPFLLNQEREKTSGQWLSSAVRYIKMSQASQSRIRQQREAFAAAAGEGRGREEAGAGCSELDGGGAGSPLAQPRPPPAPGLARANRLPQR